MFLLNNKIIYLFMFLMHISLNILLHGPLTYSKWVNDNCYTGYGN
jgi:hypothetical protein